MLHSHWSEYFNIILLFSSLLFSIFTRCSSLLSPHPIRFCPLPLTKPLPSADHSISHFLFLDLHLKGRTSELHPIFAISCPAPMWICVCVFRFVVGSGHVFVFVAVGLCFPICGHFGAIFEIFGGILFTVFSDVAVVGAAVKIEWKRKKDKAEVEKQKLEWR